MSFLVKASFLLLLLSMLFPANAFAYIDPGSASLALQAIIAGVIGGVFAIKTFGRRVVGMLKGKRGDSDTPDSPPAKDE